MNLSNIYMSVMINNNTISGTFDGVISDLKRKYHETDSVSSREEIIKFMRTLPCPSCNGTRLKKEGTSVRVGGHNIIKTN